MHAFNVDEIDTRRAATVEKCALINNVIISLTCFDQQSHAVKLGYNELDGTMNISSLLK